MTNDKALDLIAALSQADRKRFQNAMWDPNDPGRRFRLMLLLRSASAHERETFYAGLPPEPAPTMSQAANFLRLEVGASER